MWVLWKESYDGISLLYSPAVIVGDGTKLLAWIFANESDVCLVIGFYVMSSFILRRTIAKSALSHQDQLSDFEEVYTRNRQTNAPV